MNFQIIFLLATFAFCAHAEELDSSRLSCSSKNIKIPSGKVVTSDTVSLKYGDIELDGIIDEECKYFMGLTSSRVKRRSWKTAAKIMGSAIKSTAKQFGKATKKTAKKVWHYGKKATKGGKKVASGIGKTMSFAGNSLDFGERIHQYISPYWNTEKVDSSEIEAVQREENEEELEAFRTDVSVLLETNKFQGLLLKTQLVQNAITSSPFSKLVASDMRCARDDFTGRYTLFLRLNKDEYIDVQAQSCGDIGHIELNDGLERIYEFFELPDAFFVKRHDQSYEIIEEKCQNHESSIVCPETSLRSVICSYSSVEKCDKTSKNSSERIIRKLPFGYVYYGPEAEMTNSRRNSKYLRTHHLESHEIQYIRASENNLVEINGEDINSLI